MTTAATSTSETGGVFSAAAVQGSGDRAVALLAEAERLTVEAVGELGLIDRAGLSELWGYRSTERLVAHRTGRTNREGGELVAIARLAARHPLTGAALAAGEITLAQAVGLARAARGFDDAYEKYEPQLLAACRDRDADALARLVAQWRTRCDDTKAAADAEHRFNARGVFIQHGLDGSCKGTFRLDPVAAATVNDALATRPDSTGLLHEPRTLAQRRADKLTDICHTSIHGHPDLEDEFDPDPGRPTSDTEPDPSTSDPSPDPDRHGPAAPAEPSPDTAHQTDPDPDWHDPAAPAPDPSPDPKPTPGVMPDWAVGPLTRRPRRRRRRGRAPSTTDVIIDIETLAGGDPTTIERLRSELTTGAPINGPALDRLLCDTAFRALITDGPRTLLAYNRATPAIPPGLRRAIMARDQHCVFPGCDYSRIWCDLHHVIPRNRGGPTNHDNLVLLCRFHHGLVHDGGWHLARAPDGTITATSP